MLKGPKTPMHGRLQENRRDGRASDVRGGVIDPEAPIYSPGEVPTYLIVGPALCWRRTRMSKPRRDL